MVARAVVIAAPASGSGKTTIATGLMGALRSAERSVAPFKVGPDYIDPGYHAVAAGRPGRNLDAVLCGPERIAPLYRHGAAGCDVAVVEGVMGLFDGRITADETAGVGAVGIGSTADVAAALHAPVVLVVDARGHSQSLAAVLAGFCAFRSDVAVAGVILNRVSSPRHERVLRAAAAHAGLEVLGAVPSAEAIAVPERHLGLIPAVERAAAAVDAEGAMTELVAAHVDVRRVADLAARVPDGRAWDPAAEVSIVAVRPVVALAGGPAFSFGYAEHEELLTAAGADVRRFDPLVDELPPGATAAILPGGFPEMFAAQLSANTALRAQIRALVDGGGVVHAECAGLLYLARELDGVEMAAAVPASAAFTPRLTLGYRDAVALGDSFLHRAGERVTGHEFHRTEVVRDRGAADGAAGPAWGWRTDAGQTVTDGFAGPHVHASYLHTHPAGNPTSVERLVRAAG
ncbi:cobyrinate a,c-diamide synthase [Tsukamurella soli]|uniref:Hydrogenobyrinate a,c-diamide synthase n=1 Tax=Tsukamurella soli TaxID=644556 RepID=A0ABP8KJJ9_9ACTN